jgi:hypothetical protein
LLAIVSKDRADGRESHRRAGRDLAAARVAADAIVKVLADGPCDGAADVIDLAVERERRRG